MPMTASQMLRYLRASEQYIECCVTTHEKLISAVVIAFCLEIEISIAKNFQGCDAILPNSEFSRCGCCEQ